ELYDPTTGAWSETGKLNTFRSRHSATLLQNGKVLVAGGVSDFDTDLIDVAVSELYDPDTGTWSTTGKLNTYRFNHTATLLQNGKILVAGGANGSVLIDSAELYDPDTGTWSNTGNLNIPRNDPATLLHSGKVLVAGSDTAELYDPQAGTWSRTAGLNAPRVSYTATLLPDGRVLAAGGKSSSSAAKLNSSEIFEPDTETWIGPPLPVITGTSIVGKKLLVFGDNFVPGAVVFRNGTALKTKNSGDTRTLVAKGKAGKKIRPGDRLHVLNPSGALSKEFVFSDS
ncbi:MAG TPA: kelch repeat-containing protein, partial [Blastocatellia bacterium]|nr:kelch repeat-containing protein [Blastocatellia bacterium]